jgi:glutamine amidotransferase
MIKIVDYGLGNISAFSNMYKRMNVPVAAAKTVAELEGATKIILPGVGAFDHAIELLDASGMRSMLEKLVCDDKIPVLGICVGMQLLAKGSDEGNLPGLGWVPGRVRAFKSEEKSANLPLPHMGWNDVIPVAGSRLFDGLERDSRFYFLHSYFFECEQQGSVVATSSYGIDFSCAVRSGNVYGVQFHPEKSHHYGSLLLRNFAEL